MNLINNFYLIKHFKKILFFLKKFRFDLIKIRLKKIAFVINNPNFLCLAKNGIFPSIEHLKAIDMIKESQTLIDCGCSKGQFFTLFNYKKNIAYLFCFDPLFSPNYAINYLKKRNTKVLFIKRALSSKKGKVPFYLSERKDSSSLKKIKETSVNYFADVKFKNLIYVDVNTLNDYENLIKDLPKPISIKLDVQGSEYELLLGSEKILKYIKYLFIEINFHNIYEVESNANDILDFLLINGFENTLKYNKSLVNGEIISYDYLFTKKNI